MTTTTLFLSTQLTRTASARQRRARRPRDRGWWWPSWLRPRVHALSCDRCTRPMVDFWPVGDEHICIRCVAETRLPLAGPELAGATAVLRTLWFEAELEWREQVGRPYPDRRRFDALVETAEFVLWWLTPVNLRKPDAVAVGRHTAMAAIASFDHVWPLRGNDRSLGSVFAAWKQSQAKALHFAELADVDRRYAAWIAAEAQGQ